MAKYAMYIDCFSEGLDGMKRKEQRDQHAVLLKLSTMKRFSVFEATENQVIARTLTSLKNHGLIKLTGGEFPWHEFEITDAGKEFMARENSAAQTK